MKRKRKPLEDLKEEGYRVHCKCKIEMDARTGLICSNTNKKNNAKVKSIQWNFLGNFMEPKKNCNYQVSVFKET